MKKLSGFISALALLIGMTACQNEVQPVEPSEDTVTATIGVSVPGALKTKAFGEASDLTEVNYEIWNEDFSEIVQKDVISLDAELKGTLELKLIRFKTYNVLFWAQGASAKHTWTNLKEINIDYSTNVENDAFAGRVLNINATNDMNLAHNVALVRPFAQVNFATDDLGAKGVAQGDLTLKSAKVTVPGLATTYDLINGVGLTPKEVVFTSETVMPEPFVMNEVNYDHIMVFYPLVADGEATLVNLKAEFEVNCGSEVLPVSWTGKGAMNNVPVQADYRTNFYGSLFTNSGNIDVKIDKDFTEIVEPNLNIDTKTIADLASAPEGTYLLEGTITNVEPVSEGFEKVTITDASSSSIDLTLSTTQADLAVKAAATHYQVGDVIKVIVEKTADAVAPLEVLNHSRDVEDIYLEVAAGNDVTLTENVVINHGPIVVAEGQEVVIDLGAYTISNGKELWSSESKNWSLISVQGGKLTLKGTEGGLKALENDCYAVDVRNGGELVIEGGNYVGNISAVYVLEGTATIKGGNFSILQKSTNGDGYEEIINCYDANYAAGKASAVISGGVFQKFNPAAANDAALLAEGYIATYDETAGTYTVIEKPAAVAPETSKTLPFTSATMGDFTINDVELGGLSYVWKEDTSNGYMKANAYASGTDYTTESWLESPWFDLTSAAKAYVSFSHCANYFSEATPESMLGIYIKEFGGEWTALEIDNWPTGKNWNFYDVELELASAYLGKYVQFGVKYTSDAEVEAGTYEINSFRIAETEKPYVTVSETNISVQADATSATFEVESNYEWTVSSDNDAFTTSVSGNTVTVAFAANSSSEAILANITVNGAEGIKQTVKITQEGVVSANQTKITLNVAEEAPVGFPVDSSAGLSAETSYTWDGYTWKFSATGGKFYYFSSNKAILIGKSGAYVLLPAVEGKALKSVTMLAPSGASGKVTVGIYNAEGTEVVDGGAAVIPAKGDNTVWNLTGTEVNTSYQLRITNANNSQFQTLTLIYE